MIQDLRTAYDQKGKTVTFTELPPFQGWQQVDITNYTQKCLLNCFMLLCKNSPNKILVLNFSLVYEKDMPTFLCQANTQYMAAYKVCGFSFNTAWRGWTQNTIWNLLKQYARCTRRSTVSYSFCIYSYMW